MQAQHFKTDIEYLLVLDFQATCDDNVKLSPCSEIIQFPVTIVHTPTARKLDTFHHYVRPTYHPKLTPFCTQLTGITQAKVDSGITIDQVLQKLEKWIAAKPYLKEGNWTFVTCGDWDLATCLKHQARSKKLKLQPYMRCYINIKKYFVKIIPDREKSGGMMQMLAALNLKHDGRHHSGVDDVANICNICIELIVRKGATFPKQEINRLKYYVEKDGYNTEIEYLVVLDFEATCQENKKLAPCSEIIEFPAIIVHTASAKRVAQFHHYVKPKYNPQLTAFCTQLTGITQDKVEAEKHLQQILQDFDAWIRSLPFMREDNWTFVTCGDWDLSNCLKTQAQCKGIVLKNYFKSYLNVKKYFSRVTKGPQRVDGMMKMLKILGLQHEGRHHSGIDDVANISNICIELIVACQAAFPRKEIIHIKY